MTTRPEVGPFNLRPLSEQQQRFSPPPAHADLHLSTFGQAVFRIPNCFPSYVLHANSYGSGATASCRGLAHESDFRIQEHYTDTNGFTEHVFVLMHLLAFRFAPRIRDLADTELYIPGSPHDYPALASMIGSAYNEKLIR